MEFLALCMLRPNLGLRVSTVSRPPCLIIIYKQNSVILKFSSLYSNKAWQGRDIISLKYITRKMLNLEHCIDIANIAYCIYIYCLSFVSGSDVFWGGRRVLRGLEDGAHLRHRHGRRCQRASRRNGNDLPENIMLGVDYCDHELRSVLDTFSKSHFVQLAKSKEKGIWVV